MLFAQLLVKMPHVEVRVLFAIELQHVFYRRHGNPFRTGLTLAAVVQTVIAVLLVPLAPAPHGSIRHSDDLGRLPPLQAARHGFQNHFLHLHHPLHFRDRYLLVDCFHIYQRRPPLVLKRTNHVLIRPDRSHANNTYGEKNLTLHRMWAMLSL